MRFDALARFMFQPKIAILLLLASYNYHTCNAHRGTQDHIKSHVTDDGRLHIHGPHSLMDQLSVQPEASAANAAAESDQFSDQQAPPLGSLIGFGNPIMVQRIPEQVSSMKRKRDCLPSVSTRSYFANTIKRSPYLAATVEEMEAKRQSDQVQQEHQMRKRSGEDTLLPWTCETQYEWRDMGAESYPRFVRTAECKTKYCVRGFYRCTPRKYKTKILKRNNGSATNGDGSCEEDDTSLPESLRNNWKFVTVTINLCCDCTGPGRVPTSDD